MERWVGEWVGVGVWVSGRTFAKVVELCAHLGMGVCMGAWVRVLGWVMSGMRVGDVAVWVKKRQWGVVELGAPGQGWVGAWGGSCGCVHECVDRRVGIYGRLKCSHHRPPEPSSPTTDV